MIKMQAKKLGFPLKNGFPQRGHECKFVSQTKATGSLYYKKRLLKSHGCKEK